MLISSTVFLGSLITLMVFLNSIFSQYTNTGTSLLLIHLTGTITIFITYFLFKRDRVNINLIPKFFLTTGIMGVLMVVLDNLIIREIGTSVLVVLTIAGQLFLSVIVDSFGLFGRKIYKLDSKKSISLILVGIGVVLMYLK